MWTEFWDMHSGGSQKEDWDKIYIEAPKAEAIVIFYNRFGHNPERVTCSCCGEDYSINEYPTLEEATAFHRNCRFDSELNKFIDEPANDGWGKYKSLDDHLKSSNILVVRADEIKDSERVGEVPDQGFVWV